MMGFAWNDDEDRKTIVYVILAPENIERMSQGNPTCIPPKETGGLMRHVKYPQNMGLVVCYEPDFESLKALVAEHDFGSFLQHLTRNLDPELPMLEVFGLAIPVPKTAQA